MCFRARWSVPGGPLSLVSPITEKLGSRPKYSFEGAFDSESPGCSRSSTRQIMSLWKPRSSPNSAELGTRDPGLHKGAISFSGCYSGRRFAGRFELLRQACAEESRSPLPVTVLAIGGSTGRAHPPVLAPVRLHHGFRAWCPGREVVELLIVVVVIVIVAPAFINCLHDGPVTGSLYTTTLSRRVKPCLDPVHDVIQISRDCLQRLSTRQVSQTVLLSSSRLPSLTLTSFNGTLSSSSALFRTSSSAGVGLHRHRLSTHPRHLEGECHG